ncbi:MAG: SDR family oxidoreductase [Candidatus Didemnitutus sp.]|nr:SDR family oxidoreductase [Candidatus Didemnitutus sp.]
MSVVEGIFGLQGKTIAVVGATGAVGRACATLCGQLGAGLVLCSRKVEEAEHLPSGARVAFDLENAAAFAAVVQQMPRLDGVVFSAGITAVRPLVMTDATLLRRIFTVNTEGPLALLRELVRGRRLNPGASVVLLGSVAGLRGSTGYTAYSASKAALSAAVRCMAVELAAVPIRVNVISPGMLETPMAESADRLQTVAQAAAYSARYPLGKGLPMDAAKAAAFLLSPASRWITGTELVVDGGCTLH